MLITGNKTEPQSSMIVDGRKLFWGSRTFILGIINVTPDSFSGDGLAYDVKSAVDRALQFQDDGADFVDVGGESTRPPGSVYGLGAPSILETEEIRRVLPVILELKRSLTIPISIDTYKARVAEKAIEAGASMINDVWGLQRDRDLARVASEAGVPLVLTHNQTGTNYAKILEEVGNSLEKSIDYALSCGVREENIIVDPGIGFGKTPEGNLELLRKLDLFKERFNKPVLIGPSRKSTIGIVLGGLGVDDRLEGTSATVALSIAKGVDIVRVHDVKAIARVARMSDAIVRGWDPA